MLGDIDVDHLRSKTRAVTVFLLNAKYSLELCPGVDIPLRF